MPGPRTTLSFTLPVLLLALNACSTIRDQPRPASSGQALISDSAHQGNEHFYFLPPMVPNPSPTGVFDGQLSPEVEICEWTGEACATPLLARFTTASGPGSETVRAVPSGEHYLVNWHTDQFDLDTSKIYRVRVLVADFELGFADLALGGTGRELKNVNTDDFIPLLDGRTLPIKFRIEEGAVAYPVGPDGATISALRGKVVLSIPAGALTSEVAITIAPAAPAAPEDLFVVPGASFELGPDGTQFALPVRVTLQYDPNQIPLHLDESSLVMLTEHDGVWSLVSDSTVDTATRTVSGETTHFSRFSIGIIIISDPFPPPVNSVCGNGTVEQGEWCDGAALGGRTCASLGFDQGTLRCTSNCSLDSRGCVVNNWATAVATTDTLSFWGSRADLLAVDALGNTLTTGHFRGSGTIAGAAYASTVGSPLPYHFYVAKTDAKGTPVWRTVVGGGPGDDAFSGGGHAIAVDGAGNSYVVGSFTGTGSFGGFSLTGPANFVAKIDPQGDFVWITQGPGGPDTLFRSIGVDETGNTYIAGIFRNTITLAGQVLISQSPLSVFVAKLNSNGAFVWARQASGLAVSYEPRIAVDPAGNSHVGGAYASAGGDLTFGTLEPLTSIGGNDIFVTKLDTNGAFVWAVKAGGEHDDFFKDIAVDAAGQSFITGTCGAATFGSIPFANPGDGVSQGSWMVYVAKLDAAGNFVWVTPGGSPETEESASAIALDGSSNPYIAGYFKGSTVLGDMTLTDSSTFDIFAAKLDGTTGKFLWAASGGGQGDDYGMGIAVSPDGSAHVGGMYGDNATFGNATLPSPVSAGYGEGLVVWKLVPRQRIFVGVGLGRFHTCGIRTDGTIECWGLNDHGQSTPPSGSFSQVTTGWYHTCGLRTDGTVTCWGDSTSGKTTPPTGTYRQVAAGSEFSCGITTGRTITCWGDDSGGQSSPPAGTFAEISAGDDYACAIGTDRSLTCWGHNYSGQSSPPAGAFIAVSAGHGNSSNDSKGACGLRVDGSVACWGGPRILQYAPTGPPGSYRQVSTGRDFVCVLNTDGTIGCAGAPSIFGAALAPAGTFSQVASGLYHSCGIRTDGTIACWGSNVQSKSTPPSGPVVQVSTSGSHSCAIKTDRTLQCWGRNQDGQVAPPPGTFKQITTGSQHSCGLRSDGTIACWGSQADGRSSAPPGSFLSLSAGDAHTCALKDDWTIVCWGADGSGQASPPSGIYTQVTAGAHHSCGRLLDRSIVCWGHSAGWTDTDLSTLSGSYNQISGGASNTCGLASSGSVSCKGSDLYGQSSPPTGSFFQISAGDVTACGIRTSGTAVCWGDNPLLTDPFIPPDPADTFIQIDAGSDHACGVKPDGSMACWGRNSVYQEALPPRL